MTFSSAIGKLVLQLKKTLSPGSATEYCGVSSNHSRTCRDVMACKHEISDVMKRIYFEICFLAQYITLHFRRTLKKQLGLRVLLNSKCHELDFVSYIHRYCALYIVNQSSLRNKSYFVNMRSIFVARPLVNSEQIRQILKSFGLKFKVSLVGEIEWQFVC